MTEPAISASGELLYRRVTPLMEHDETYGWFGRYLCDALMGMLQGLDQIVLDQTINGMDYPGWCTLASPSVCPDDWLDWCASLYGVTLSPGISAAAKRATIEDLPPQKRGGIGSMARAAEATLTGTKHIALVERAAGHAYRIVASTRTSETPSEEATLAALLGQKPAGVKLIYTTSERAEWAVATKEWTEVAPTVEWASVATGEV